MTGIFLEVSKILEAAALRFQVAHGYELARAHVECEANLREGRIALDQALQLLANEDQCEAELHGYRCGRSKGHERWGLRHKALTDDNCGHVDWGDAP